MFVVSRILPKQRAAAGTLIAAACIATLAGCANTVSSHSLVKPSQPLAAQAIEVTPNGQSVDGMHLVYAYGAADYQPQCDAPATTTPGPLQRYGVTLCEGDKPLAIANFVADASARGTPDAAAQERLARIAESSLVPQPPVLSNP